MFVFAPARMRSSLIETIESVIDLTAFNEEVENEKSDAAQLVAIKKSVSDHLADLKIGCGNE